MDEWMNLIFSTVCALLAVQTISVLFPDKSSTLVRGLAVLSILCVLLRGVLQTEFKMELPDSTWEQTVPEEDSDAMYAKIGTELLQERLYTLLEAAGIQTVNKQNGIEIRYRMDDEGTIEIDGVYVQLVYAADRDRAFALLRSVLTETIPLSIYAD